MPTEKELKAIEGSLGKWYRISNSKTCLNTIASKCDLCFYTYEPRTNFSMQRSICQKKCPLAKKFHDCNDPKSVFSRLHNFVLWHVPENYTLINLKSSAQTKMANWIRQMIQQLEALKNE